MEDNNRGWHLEKNVSVGHIITTISVACTVLIWAMAMDTRVTVLEREVVHSQQADERLEAQLKDSIVRIEAAVIRIENTLREKVDR